MSMSGSNDAKEEHGSAEQTGTQDQGDTGHTGEGAASAMAHMIARGRQQRHQTGEADDAAGSQRQ